MHASFKNPKGAKFFARIIPLDHPAMYAGEHRENRRETINTENNFQMSSIATLDGFQ